MSFVEQQTQASHGQALSPAQLEKLGVRPLNKFDLELECLSCGEVWEPKSHLDGSLEHDFWTCPNRCNSDSQTGSGSHRNERTYGVSLRERGMDNQHVGRSEALINGVGEFVLS
jgi:hypothetical protein